MAGKARPERSPQSFHRHRIPVIAGAPKAAFVAATLHPGRKNFRAPPRVCNAGIPPVTWLNCHQSQFIMPAGFQSARSIGHDAEVCRLVAAVRPPVRPDLAGARTATVLTLHGVDQ